MFGTIEEELNLKGYVDVKVMLDKKQIGRIHAANGVVVCSYDGCCSHAVASMTVAKYEFGDPNFIDFVLE